MTTRLSALLIALPLLAQQAAGPGTKLSDIPARDAAILADADSRTYYLYVNGDAGHTNPDLDDVLVYSSRDLIDWHGPSTAFRIPDQTWANPAQGARHPGVYAYRGGYYLLVTLANSEMTIARPPESWRVNTMQGTQIFASDFPQGPFAPMPDSTDRPHTPPDYVALGGTLYFEGDLAYLVYIHDWTQVVDATVEAVRLKADLSAAVGEAMHLFKASDDPWLQLQTAAAKEPRYYPAGGPLLYRTANGSLLLIWTSMQSGKPAIILARSVTGKLRGPWQQTGSLSADGSEPGTLFRAFDGRLLMIVHRPAAGGTASAGLLELEDAGDTLQLKPAAAKRKVHAR
jgi:hypothetical protein